MEVVVDGVAGCGDLAGSWATGTQKLYSGGGHQTTDFERYKEVDQSDALAGVQEAGSASAHVQRPAGAE